MAFKFQLAFCGEFHWPRGFWPNMVINAPLVQKAKNTFFVWTFWLNVALLLSTTLKQGKGGSSKDWWKVVNPTSWPKSQIIYEQPLTRWSRIFSFVLFPSSLSKWQSIVEWFIIGLFSYFIATALQQVDFSSTFSTILQNSFAPVHFARDSLTLLQ